MGMAFRKPSSANLMAQSDSLGTNEMVQRQSSYRDGSERLCDAIEDLIVRTSKRLAIPAEHRDRPLAFARAYLGMTV